MNTFKMFGREWEKLDFKPWSGPNGEGEPNAWYDPDRVIVQARSVKLEMIPGYVFNFTDGPNFFKGDWAQTGIKAAQCGGIRLTESLGYGLYRIRLGSELCKNWSPRTCFAFWLDWGPHNKCEIVFEAGEMITDGGATQFVIFDDPEKNNMAMRETFPALPLYREVIFLWTPKKVAIAHGYSSGSKTIKNYGFVTRIHEGNIEPNGELLTINMRTLGPPDITKKTGVTISGFEYLPLDSKKCIETMRRLGL